MKWIHDRHDAFTSGRLAVRDQSPLVRAPWQIAIFGERGFGVIVVSDVTSAPLPDYRRTYSRAEIESLFPEAQVEHFDDPVKFP